jgi:hypothetical protein
MVVSWTDKRREFRFQLKGSFSRSDFIVGQSRVHAEPIDISRTGLGLIIDARWNPQGSERIMSLEIPDQLSPILLVLRYHAEEREAPALRPRTRCGLELSERDKHRGVDLISLLSREPFLSLHLSA